MAGICPARAQRSLKAPQLCPTPEPCQYRPVFSLPTRTISFIKYGILEINSSNSDEKSNSVKRVEYVGK
jgi:hypothetical protein